MEQNFSRITFRNSGYTMQACLNILENCNNWKILFHSAIPTWVQFLQCIYVHASWLCCSGLHMASFIFGLFSSWLQLTGKMHFI